MSTLHACMQAGEMLYGPQKHEQRSWLQSNRRFANVFRIAEVRSTEQSGVASQHRGVSMEELKNEPYIKCDSLVRIYKSEGIEVMALQGLDMEIQKGELMAIIGKSGSGKSTLLGLLGGLDTPSAGAVYFGGENLAEMNSHQLSEFRRKHIGFVWQKNTDNLLGYLTVAENIEMPLLFSRMSKQEKREKTRKLLAAVGLSDKENAFPLQLSGGEQQRVAIATALINEPELLLMDEPTGAVDKKTSIMLQDLFRSLNKELGITVVIVTHDISLADRVDRVVMISDGKISSERIIKDSYKKMIESGEETRDYLAAAGNTDIDAESHEEFAILDKAGRVRLSENMREMAGITSNRVKIHFEDGKIIIHSEDMNSISVGGDGESGITAAGDDANSDTADSDNEPENTDDQIQSDELLAAKDHADIDDLADAEISESRDDLTDSGDE